MGKASPNVPAGLDQQTKVFLEHIKEAVDVGDGHRGDPLDRKLTARDLVDLGLATALAKNAKRIVSGVNFVNPNAPSLNVPPSPKHLTVSGGIGLIFLTWDNANLAYSNHSYTEIWRAFTDNIAVAQLVGMTATSFMYTDVSVSYTENYFYWIRFVSTADVKGDWNSDAGTPGHCEQNPAEVLELISGQIRETHLYQTLRDKIDLIDASGTGLVDISQENAQDIIDEANTRLALAQQLRGSYTGTDLNQLSSGLIKQERTERINETASLSQQMALLTAGSSNQFDHVCIWYFDTTVEGWIGNPSAPTIQNVGWIRPANHASDPYIRSPAGLAVDSVRYTQVRARLRKTGSPLWAGQVLWKRTVDPSHDGSRSLAIAQPAWDADSIALVTWNVPWNGTIDEIRLDITTNQDASNYMELDWVAIGRPSPGASAAELFTEQTARANADIVLSGNIVSLTSTVNGKANSTALNALDARVTTTENTLTSQSTQVSNLTNSVAGKADTSALNATTSRVTSAEGTLTSHTSQLNSLNATIVGKADSSALNNLSARVTTTETSINSQSSQITALNNSINSKADSSALNTTTSRVTSAEGTLTSHTSQLNSLNATIAGKADSSALNSLSARVTTTENSIASQSSQVTQLTGSVSSTTQQVATLQQTATASANTLAGATANWGVKVQLDGYGRRIAAGFGLDVLNTPTGASSIFGVRANEFFIADPNSSATKIPFIVSGGVVYIDSAVIRDGTIGSAKISDLSVTKLTGDAASFVKLNVGTLVVDDIQGDVSGVYALQNYVTATDFGQYTGSGFSELKGGQVIIGSIVVPARSNSRLQGLAVYVSGVATKGAASDGYVKAEFYEAGSAGSLLGTFTRTAGTTFNGNSFSNYYVSTNGSGVPVSGAPVPADWTAILIGETLRAYIDSNNFIEGTFSQRVPMSENAGPNNTLTGLTLVLTDVIKFGSIPNTLVGCTLQRFSAGSRTLKPMGFRCAQPVMTGAVNRETTYTMSAYDVNARLATGRTIYCSIGFYSAAGVSTFINKQLTIAVAVSR